MTEWQPIAVAPQEEDTSYLIWDGDCYHVAYISWFNADGGAVWFNGDVTVKPTHWMPLPEPPHD